MWLLPGDHPSWVIVRWLLLTLAVGLVTHDFWLLWVTGAAGLPFVRRAERRHVRKAKARARR